MRKNNSGGKLEKFFTGKGYYIVLFLCASVIGVSAWMLMAGNRTMIKKPEEKIQGVFNPDRTETIILPPAEEKFEPVIRQTEPLEEEREAEDELIVEEENPEEEPVQETVMELPSYIWPVSGRLERVHDGKNLKFDETMQDWRSHEGIDILSTLGCPVEAVRAGTVLSCEKDGLYGITVKIDHGDGLVSVYANLQEPAAVSPGEYVEAGAVVGAVGDTAICESSQSSHLHFAMEQNGMSVDPMLYLPA